MPQIMNVPTAKPHAEPMPRRSLDGVMIALSAGLLVIFGIVIGRFVVTTQAVEVVDHFDAELSTLRSEVTDLQRQLLLAESQVAALQETADGYRQLAEQQQTRADRLIACGRIVAEAADRHTGARDACLAEIQQYVALDRPIPAIDVLRFAQEMFDAHGTTLRHLAGHGDPSLVSIPPLPRLTLGDTAMNAIEAGRSDQRVASTAIDGPRLPSALPAPSAEKPATQQGGTYFNPPPPRRKPTGYTFFAPRRTEHVATFHQPSGVTFHETADAGDTVRR